MFERVITKPERKGHFLKDKYSDSTSPSLSRPLHLVLSIYLSVLPIQSNPKKKKHNEYEYDHPPDPTTRKRILCGTRTNKTHPSIYLTPRSRSQSDTTQTQTQTQTQKSTTHKKNVHHHHRSSSSSSSSAPLPLRHQDDLRRLLRRRRPRPQAHGRYLPPLPSPPLFPLLPPFSPFFPPFSLTPFFLLPLLSPFPSLKANPPPPPLGLTSYTVNLAAQSADVYTDAVPFDAVLEKIRKTGKEVRGAVSDGVSVGGVGGGA